MMRKILYIIIVQAVALFNVYSQETGIRIIHPVPDSVLQWNIRNTDQELVISGDFFSGMDTAAFDLMADTRYYLEVSGTGDYNPEDSILLMLELYEEPIMLIASGLEAGDHSYPFHTGKKPSQLKIIGGENASIEDFPWQVYFRSGNYMCGGSIIGDDWIITAAHCVFDDAGDTIPASRMYVRVGTATPYITTTGKIYYVEQAIVHEEYNEDELVNDIALLKLKEPIDFENATAIELISALDVAQGDTDPGVIATVTGWGKSSVNPDEFPEILQKVDLPIVSNETAEEVWHFTIPETQLTAGYRAGNKDACNGDSGGPLVVDTDNGLKIAGIVSWGSTLCNTYGSYTRISSFEDWIRTKTGIEARYTPPAAIGDSIICPDITSSVFNLESLQDVSSYEWSFEPAEAGVISSSDDTQATIDWEESYLGSAKIMYRVTMLGELTPWAVKDVNRVPFTTILTQPVDSNVCAQSSLNLQVTAEGNMLTYSFYKDDVYLGQFSNGLYKIGMTLASHTGSYYTVVQGSCGVSTTDNYLITVVPVTNVNSITEGSSVAYGSDVTIEIDADGDQLHYQWYKDDVALDIADNSSYEISGATAGNTGIYSVLVSGTCGSELSESSYLLVKPEEIQNENGVILFPTITNGNFEVATESSEVYSVEIYGSNGGQILRRDDCSYNTDFDLSGYARGIYVVIVQQGGISERFKLILY